MSLKRRIKRPQKTNLHLIQHRLTPLMANLDQMRLLMPRIKQLQHLLTLLFQIRPTAPKTLALAIKNLIPLFTYPKPKKKIDLSMQWELNIIVVYNLLPFLMILIVNQTFVWTNALKQTRNQKNNMVTGALHFQESPTLNAFSMVKGSLHIQKTVAINIMSSSMRQRSISMLPGCQEI